MTIDILSDLHFDNYFPLFNNTEENIRKLYDGYFLRDSGIADALIIAGDIGHYNNQNIILLKKIKNIYGYKYIICVLGNHDYYLNNRIEQDDYDLNSFNRVEEMRALINAEDGMHCLNGDVIEIDGIRFGGCDSSYSNAYLKAYYPLADHPKANNEMWRNCMYDHKMMFGVNQYNQIYKEEVPKIEAIYKECDVMVTHVNPSFLHEHLSPLYHGEQANMFFSFDGHRFMKNGTMKYWVYGHTHEANEYEYEGVTCICNPLGYPGESKHLSDTLVKRIEL